LLGALPLWSASVSICAAVVLLLVLILFPYRLQMIVLGITAATVAFLQLFFLGSGAFGAAQQALFHWPGLDLRAIANVIGYIGLAAGAKWPVIILAFVLLSSFERRFFLAWCGLLILPFWIRFSGETSIDQTFLNVWLVMANLLAAYGLWWLWNCTGVPALGALTASALAACILAGGMVDLFPIRNSSYVEMNYERDDLVKWLSNNTKPNDLFLTDRFHTHSILLAGRKIFLGPDDLLALHDSHARVSSYQQMFESKNPRRVFELLKQNHIDYVAIDDVVRHGNTIRDANEYLYGRYFQRVYEDKEDRYHKLAIYKVPSSAPPNVKSMDLSEPPVTAFHGGKGSGKGQFDDPRGLALDNNGNILVADTGNARIEKFSPNGSYISSLGTKAGYGQLGQPNGLAIDRAGNIYVTDLSTHSVRNLTADGKPIAQWTPDLYGPRRIAIGPDDSIYVVDQGHNRIVKLNLEGEVLTTWGSAGTDDGQFRDPTSVAVDPISNKIYVADPINHRIQIFDSAGNFVSKWPVAGWGEPHGFEDLAIDAQRGRLYASSGNINTILAFDLNGNAVGTLEPMPPNKLSSPSALAIAKDKLLVLNSASAQLSFIVLQNTPSPPSRGSDR
jgi:sugar lactone lactonase YvrE